MNREEVRQTIRSKISCKDYLEKSPKGNYICPFCGSGTGPNKSGALAYYDDTNTWYCFSCNESGDVIDLYKKKTGSNYNEALSLLADSLGITIDRYFPENNSEVSGTEKIRDLTSNENVQSESSIDEPVQRDYMDYYKECRKHINDPLSLAYLEKRGISLATAETYWIGFDSEADPANAPGCFGTGNKKHPTPRLIIPTNNRHYVARRIDGVEGFEKLNPKDSTPGIFNGKILSAQTDAIFITEGIFDALSIIEVGSPAVAINSTSNVDSFLKKLEEKQPTATLILCLDNDDAGIKGTEKLKDGLRRLNISFITANVSGDYKDPNEFLIHDRQAFTKSIIEAQRKTAVKPDNTSIYLDHFILEDIEKFNASKKKTGFSYLDKKSGGLYEGLYVLAALSSLGKTSFALQMADQLAASGSDVIFFSLEQSKLELISKSLARIATQKFGKQEYCNALSIRGGYWKTEIHEAVAEYKQKVGDRFTVVEGNFNCNISFIGDYIRHYMNKTQKSPVVFIDYLQILQPEEDQGKARQTLREAIDNAVTTLKRLSRELHITIFLISSVNRANYLTPIDFESLKESGGIEYTADVIWGMQLQCLNGEAFEKNPQSNVKERREIIRNCKKANPRRIELLCLKNRYGVSSYSCFYDYYPAHDLFEETENMGGIDTGVSQKKAGRKL